MELLPLSLLRVAACSGLGRRFQLPFDSPAGTDSGAGNIAGKPPVVRWRLL
jgi:hypothetical protein